MGVVVITAPTEPVVSLDEVKAHLRVEHDDDDDEIESLIWAALTEFEDPNLGWLGRSICERELELRLDCFGHCIQLPCGPLLLGGNLPDDYTFTVKYDDVAGVEHTLAEAFYRILDAERARPRLVLKTGQSWPSTASHEQAVRIRYWAGYPTDDRRLEGFKSAVKLHVEMAYDGDTDRQADLQRAIDRLLQPYRVYSL